MNDVLHIHTQGPYLVDSLDFGVSGVLVWIPDNASCMIKHPLLLAFADIERLAVAGIDQSIDVRTQGTHYFLRKTFYTHFALPPFGKR